MECRACNGCGCWPARCHFMSCFGRGHRLPPVQPAPPLDIPSPVQPAPPPDIPSGPDALQQQKLEFTPEQLKALIDFVDQEVARLDPASSSSSSQASISQHLSNVVAKWDEKKQICSSFIESLPKELKNQVAESGKTLLVPLISRVLGGMGEVHWLGAGFTFLAWALSNTNNFIQNREDCIGILRKSLRVLKHTKEVWEQTPNRSSVDLEELQNSVLTALYCAIFCTSNLDDHWLPRFLKATSVQDALPKLEEDLEREYNHLTLLMSKTKNVERQITFKNDDDNIVGDRESAVIEDAVTFMKDGSQNRIKAVLLHGMGGIGKSTLGFLIFTRFQEKRAYRACRVELPLNEPTDKHLCDIQRQILEKICGRAAPEISNLTDGMQHMKKELQQISQPIFLYVDNVLKCDYLSKLLPKASFFPEGSRLLITAREKYTKLVDLGISIESYKTIEVTKLPTQEAQQLFRKQLQIRGELDSKIESAEEKVLALCDGLPLALVVVGKYIAASDEGVENVEVWHQVVKAMEKAESLDGGVNDELYSRLQFSIQNLNRDVRRAFLDVAFYLGNCYMSSNCPWKRVERLVGQRNSLIVLGKRALLQIDEEWRWVEMHDVLKALGRRMAKEDQQEIRISGIDELNQLDGSDLNKVVALTNVRNVDAHRLQQMRRLRLLNRVHVMEECEKVQLSELRVVVDFECKTARVCDWSKCKSLKEVDWEGANAFNLEVL